MSKAEPTIQKFMTYLPHAVESKVTVDAAATMMTDLGIRHLPVIEDGALIGIISDRDIKMVTSLVIANPKLLVVKDICHEHPYQVHPEAKLRDVAAEMAEKRYGSVLVTQNGHLAGIFTTVDACRALSAVIEQKFHGS